MVDCNIQDPVQNDSEQGKTENNPGNSGNRRCYWQKFGKNRD